MPIHLRKAASLALLALLILTALTSHAQGSKPPHGFAGLNCAIWDPGLDSPKVETLLRQAGITALRWPGGSNSDDYDWTHPPSWAQSTAKFDHLANSLGAEVTITTNYGSGSPQMAAAWLAYCNGTLTKDVKIGVDSKGRDWKSSAYWVRLRIAKPLQTDDGLNALRIDRAMPYGYRNWEIGNECFGGWENDTHTPKHDPALYAMFAVEAIKMMRQIDPAVRIGVIVTGPERPFYGQESVFDPRTNQQTSEWTPLVLSALSKHGTRPDFVAYHHYAQDSGQESDVRLFADYQNLPQIAAYIHNEVDAYFPPKSGKHVPIDCTECNSVSFNPGPQTTGDANAIYYSQIAPEARSVGFENLIWWALHSGPITTGYDTHSSMDKFKFGDYGILGRGDRQDMPYPVYYAIKKYGSK